MIDIGWGTVLLFLMWISIPCVLGVAIFGLIFTSTPGSNNLSILCWVLLPQSVMVILFWVWLVYYDIKIDSFFSLFVPAILASISYCYFSMKCGQKRTSSLICGHVLGLIIFLFFLNGVATTISSGQQMGRDIHQLQDLTKSDHFFDHQLEDPAFRQKMLLIAVGNPKIPEATIRELIKRGADPFSPAPLSDSENDTRIPVIVAAKMNDLNILRIFFEQLKSDATQVEGKRNVLLADNPLLTTINFSYDPNKEEIKNYLALASVLLQSIPSLLNDEVYEKLIALANPELVRFMMKYHMPVKQIYRIQVMALLNDTNIRHDIAANPSLLKEKIKSTFLTTVWQYILCYSSHQTVQTIINTGAVHWEDYVDNDEKGYNRALEESFKRASKYTGDDPLVLTVVMRDMITHHIPYSSAQIAHAFYTEVQGSQVVNALLDAGMTCGQLSTALKNYISSSNFPEGKARLAEACH